MGLINTQEINSSGPVKIWLRVFSTPETITIDGYRDEYSKKEFWESKYDDRPKMLFEYEMKANLYPEFSKVTGIAYAINDGKVNTFAGAEETLLKTLNEFFRELDELAPRQKHILCGFNLYKHDIPYLWKRMIINGIKPDHHLRISKNPMYQINDYIYDVSQIRKQTGFSAELPLIAETLLGEKADGNPYSAGNICRALEKTRDIWNKIYNIFTS